MKINSFKFGKCVWVINGEMYVDIIKPITEACSFGELYKNIDMAKKFIHGMIRIRHITKER